MSRLDDDAPLRVARRLRRAGEQVALLHAAAPGPHPGRSLLAIRPGHEVIHQPGGGAGLPAIPPRLVHIASGRGLWVGAVAYDAGLGLSGIPARHPSDAPSLIASWHPCYAAYDHRSRRWRLHGADADTGEALARAIRAKPEEASAGRVRARPARSSHSRAEHIAACREARRLIGQGELFEVNLAHVIRAPWRGDGFALYEALVTRSGGDHSAFLDLAGWQVASVSPELFLRVVGGVCETRPVKGTSRRGVDAAEDARLARALSASVKDRAENVMIVDLMRNDLVATAVPGSVRVAALCGVERTASVMHLVSIVRSRLRPGVRLLDVLVSCFPPGSVTGAPKRRAMEVIDQLEHTARGFYCGSVFAWEPALKRMQASVAIRTAIVHGGVASYGAGGAVTLASDPAAEAAETLLKAGPFLQATNATLAEW